MGEFDFIDQFIRPAFCRARALDDPQALGIGDDAAILAPIPEGWQLVMTTDTLIEGRHYWPEVSPRALGHKVLAVNLSDLAAMGAMPWAFTLSLALRKPRPQWLTDFFQGMASLAKRANIDLVGGDTVSVGLGQAALESFSVTALGLVPIGQALRRDGLQIGDLVWVSGNLGDGATALAQRQPNYKLDCPEPRLALGQALRGLADAAIDVSDGLSSDLRHMVQASNRLRKLSADAALPALSIRINLMALETCLGDLLRSRLRNKALSALEACRIAASSGDEYELAFSAPASATNRVLACAEQTGTMVTPVGEVISAAGHGLMTEELIWCDAEGNRLAQDQYPVKGFDHFAVRSHAPR